MLNALEKNSYFKQFLKLLYLPCYHVIFWLSQNVVIYFTCVLIAWA